MLEVLHSETWESLCHIDMCAIEDRELAREVPETESFEPLVYLRCKDLDENSVERIQEILATGASLSCRLRVQTPRKAMPSSKRHVGTDESTGVSDFNSLMVDEAFHFKTLRIRELYRCAEFVTKKGEDKMYFKFRWMVTAIRADSQVAPVHRKPATKERAKGIRKQRKRQP